LSHLNKLKPREWLYIDCQDPIFALEDIDVATLDIFILENKITTLALDHYYDGFLKRLPKVQNIIIASRDSNVVDLKRRFALYPLDYEEFLSFGKASTSNFNNFLKAGTLPMVATVDLHAVSLEMRKFFYSEFDEDESRLMLILARHQGQRITTHQIYKYAKESFRISKDWVYKTIKKFSDEKLIIFVKDRLNKGAKKMFLYDFALSKYLSKSQSFGATFDALVVLAMLKHTIDFEALGIHGYIIKDRELVVPAAFENEDSFWKRAYGKIPLYKRYKIKRVTVVSVSNSYKFELGGIEFEAIPFYEWSIINEED